MDPRRTPVALFAYNRPRHLGRTLEALAANGLAPQTPLIVYSEGPRGESDAPAVAEVRRVLRAARGFASVTVVERPENMGLSRNIIDGVTATVQAHGRIIVLEDDMLTAPHFLDFMNAALDLYEHEEALAGVHGYAYPIAALPELFMLRMTDCWGWGTWKRAWDLFEPDGALLLDRLRSAGLTRTFDLEGGFEYTKMLEDQIAGRNDSWAVRWYAATFLAGRLGFYPGRSLVRNIGLDGSGSHGADKDLDVALAASPLIPRLLPPAENTKARRMITRYFRQSHPGPLRRLYGAARRRLGL